MHDSFVMDAVFSQGFSGDHNLQWKSGQTSITVLSPVSACDINKDNGRCTKGWLDRRFVPNLLAEKIDVPELQKRCLSLNAARDHVYSYRLDFILKYLCIKKNNNGQHFRGRGIVYSCEMGYNGLTPAMIVAIIKPFCGKLQREHQIRIHHVFSLEIRLSKAQTLSMGGSPDLITTYQKECHPAVCMCDGRRDRPLCHHWYMDSLLGNDTHAKFAHPAIVVLNGKVTNPRPLAWTIFRMADQVVFGGILAKSGIILRFNYEEDSLNLGVTSFRGNSIELTIMISSCVDPKLFAETVLHELAHTRVALDFPRYLGVEHHGTEWIQRMNEIKKLLAFRLQDYATTICTQSMNKKM